MDDLVCTFCLSGCRIARLSLIKIHLDNTPVSLADEEWHMLVDKLDGYSGSDIRSVVIGALYEPIRSMQSACYWKHNEGMGVLSSSLTFHNDINRSACLMYYLSIPQMPICSRF